MIKPHRHYRGPWSCVYLAKICPLPSIRAAPLLKASPHAELHRAGPTPPPAMHSLPTIAAQLRGRKRAVLRAWNRVWREAQSWGSAPLGQRESRKLYQPQRCWAAPHCEVSVPGLRGLLMLNAPFAGIQSLRVIFNKILWEMAHLSV